MTPERLDNLEVEFADRRVERPAQIICDLLRRLRQAWAERDALRSDVERLSAKVEAMEEGAAELRRLAEGAEAEVDALRGALQELCDWQNGPPLAGLKWEGGWGNAMETAEQALRRTHTAHAEIAEARRKVCESVGRWHRIWQEDNGLAAGYGSRLDDAERDVRETWERLSMLEGDGR